MFGSAMVKIRQSESPASFERMAIAQNRGLYPDAGLLIFQIGDGLNSGSSGLFST